MKREFDEFDQKIEKVFQTEIEVPNNVQDVAKNALNDVKKKSKMRKILNIAAIILVVCLGVMYVPQAYAKIKWEFEYREFEKRDVSYGYSSVREAMENGYEENIDMDYVYKDGVGLKVSNLMISDTDFSAQIKMKIAESIPIATEEMFNYGFAVYDDNNNIYYVVEPIEFANSPKELTYYKKLYKELGIEYDENIMGSITFADSSNSGGINNIKDRELTTEIKLTSSKGFPKSKKLYIRVFNIFNMLMEVGKDEQGRNKIIDMEKLQISDNEWIIEIDVPAKFYERENIELKLAEEVPGVNLVKAVITDTKMSVQIGKSEKLLDIIEKGMNQDFDEFRKNVNDNFHIEDEKGTVYNGFDTETFGTNSYGGVTGNFYINKGNMPEKLYLVITDGNEIQKIELVEK